MSEQTRKPVFNFTWKVLALGLVVFMVIRALAWFLEIKFQLGLGPLGQAIVAVLFGTLALFLMARKKNGKA